MARKKTASPEPVTASPAAEPSTQPETGRAGDAPEGQFELKAPPKLEARNAMIDAIAANSEAVMRAEMGDAPTPDPDEFPPDTSDLPPDEPLAPVARMVKLKVDGADLDVPEEKIRDAGIRALQKESSADARLQEASEKLRQANEMLANAQRLASQPAAIEPDSQPSADADAEVNTLARSLQFGTEDEVKAAVKTLLQRTDSGRQTAIPPPDMIVAEVEQRLEFNNALKDFQTEFKDIWADDRLRNLAFSEDQRIQQEIKNGQRPVLTYSERFAEAGKSVRAWRDQIAAPGKPRVEIDADKQARKVAAGTIPTAGGRASAGAPTAAPVNPTSIVADMRRARGQL